MKVKVKRITSPLLFRECAEMTTGKPCKMSWNRALCSGHSIIRAEEYIIKLYDIPQCAMSHLVRHIHSQPYVLSKRPDRCGKDFIKECQRVDNKLNDIVVKLDENQLIDRKDLISIQFDILGFTSKYDRLAPTNMALKLNAEEIINISKVRLCSKASTETREVWKAVVNKIREIDPDLANHCQPTCVFRGGICPEPKSCGFNKTELFNKQLLNYKKNFCNEY